MIKISKRFIFIGYFVDISGRWRWKRWTWIGCCILVICATWAHPNIPKPSATTMASMTSMASVSADVPRDRFQLSARSPSVNGTAIGCPDALKRAEDEAISMEVLTKRHWVFQDGEDGGVEVLGLVTVIEENRVALVLLDWGWPH